MSIAVSSSIHDVILRRATEGGRLSPEEALELFRCDLPSLAQAATEVRKRFHPEPHVTFVVDRNISITNRCAVACGFCGFGKEASDPDLFTLSVDQVLEKVEELVQLGGTQVLMQGGINPELGFDYYLNLVRAIHERFPPAPVCRDGVHIHSVSCVEIDFMAKQAGLSARGVLIQLKEAGLNSLPGAGAEILVERVRQEISPRKHSVKRWLEIMRTAHEIGLPTTATMVIGHAETLEERIQHLEELRKLQDETQGFRAFIPWTFVPAQSSAMKDREQTSGDDYLRTLAIARLYLDNFENIQGGWLTEGFKIGQLALAFGANDMGGILIEDKVMESAGIQVKTRTEDVVRLIRGAGFIPAQRDTNYQTLKVFS